LSAGDVHGHHALAPLAVHRHDDHLSLASTDRPYLIGPFDKLKVDVYGIEEMDREMQVDASGRVSFPLAGIMEAAGKTPAELATNLTQRLRPFVKNPQVTVNIEENGAGGAGSIPYVLPPGINRQENLATINNQLQNEQSLQLCVENLLDRYTEAVTKTITMDMLIYKKLKLFLHAEGPESLQDGDLNAMVRIGTDNTKHFYELIVPLKVTRTGSTLPNEIWPEENNIDIPFQMFVDAKVARNAAQSPIDLVTPWSYQVPGKPGWVINVVGNPDFSDVRTMLIGVQNPCTPDKVPKSACVWINELRVADFDKTAGWAATGRVNAQLADFANVVATGRYTAVGFGGLEDRIQQRARENTSQVDVAANITLDKFIPTKLGIKVPMSVGYGSTVIEPRYDPLQGDVELDQVLENIDDSDERRDYREQVISRETRRNINFMNVRKERTDPNDKPLPLDIENFSVSYAYNDILSHDPTTRRYFQKNYRGGIAYTYTTTPPSFAPFDKVAAFDSPYLKLIKDLNFSPLPNNISVRFDLDRSYSERFRQRLVPFSKQFVQAGSPTFIKSFYFTRIYDVKWNLTKSLTFDYTANNRSIIDEPSGAPTKEGNDIIWNNLKNGGRNTNFNQTAALTYRLPLDKLPFTNWLSADVRYAANYTWRANSLALTQDTTLGNLGNVIENNAEKSVNGRIDMVKLYDKVRFLRDINNPAPPAAKPGIRPGAPAPAVAAPKDSTEKPARELKALKSVLRALMTMRSVNFTYSLTEGTSLPGYLPGTKFFGFNEGFEAPGLPFILGRQYELDELYGRAAGNGWYTDSSQNLTEPLRSMRTENISARTALEPFKAFNIQLDAKMTRSRADEVFYRFNPDVDFVERQSPVELGDYNVSFIAVN
ncbi:MAG: cell surface protein SprA, partial [Sphingobacteriales bacterium]